MSTAARWSTLRLGGVAVACLAIACSSRAQRAGSDPPAPEQRRGPGEEPTLPASALTAAGETADELERLFVTSGTKARLGGVGLTEVAGDAEPAGAEAGAVVAFRLRRPDGSATADVYFFDDYDRLQAAAARLVELPVLDQEAAAVAANGAFLVRVRARGPDPQRSASAIASAIAGEE